MVDQFLMELVTAYPAIALPCAVIGGIVVLAQIIIPITPTKKDDEAMKKVMKGYPGKILNAFTAFAPIQVKGVPGKILTALKTYQAAKKMKDDFKKATGRE